MNQTVQLYTAFGETMDRKKPLPEYPRPQLVRDSYLNLNGEWDYAILKKEEKLTEYQGKILVPFSPECALSGVNRQVLPEDVLYYRTVFTLPQGFKKDIVLLHFGAVDYAANIFINGKKAGFHKGGYFPFTLDITALLQDGSNELTLSVTDPSDTGSQSKGKQRLRRGGIFYTAQSGIWQTVWMESVPRTYIRNVMLTPDIDKGTLSVVCQGIATGSAEVFDGQKQIASAKIFDGKCELRLALYELWTPENPKLYDIVIKSGEDAVKSYFGMRKFGTGKDAQGHMRLMLNNRPYFHNGLLDQGYYPDGLYTPPSDEAMIFDIMTAKKTGFNMLRKHIKIEPLRWYYHCDRLGMLVWQDMINGGGRSNNIFLGFLGGILNMKIPDTCYSLCARKDKAGREEYYIDAERTVRLLYNSVSLCLWVPFNESWGQFDALKACDFVRELDATRPIDHASGWLDQKGGDFLSRHIYFTPVRFPAGDAYGRTKILSEFGGYSLKLDGHVYNTVTSFGYRKFKSKESFAKAYKKLYLEQIVPQIQKGLAATVYTQLTDVEDEINGLLTYDRKELKLDADTLRQINAKIKL
jgi:beta-galactosidase/beta-glucuronidase